MKSQIIALAAATLLVSPTASAQANPDKRFESIADHLRRQYRPFNETTRIGSRKGREDLVMHTRANWDATFRKYKDAYRYGTVLPGGVTVRGYFVNPAKRVATFTLGQKGEKFMVVMYDDPDGARLILWGMTFANRKRYRAKRRPFHRGYPPPATMRYGL